MAVERPVEDRLVALLEAVRAPLPRGEIFSRMEQYFDDEKECAAMLGRLVADGRLLRTKRAAGGREEFVYQVHRGNAARMDVIAGAVEKVQTPAQEEPEMPKKQETDRYVELLESKKTWMAPRDVAAVLLEHAKTSGINLRERASKGLIQTRGATSNLRYAALGVPADAEPVAKSKRRDKKPEARAPRSRPRPAINTLPATTVAPRKLTWAITHNGVVAINDGTHTIELAPGDCENGVGFLQKTERLWRSAA